MTAETTQLPPVSPVGLLDDFSIWAARHPDRPAVACDEAMLTYGEVERQANRLARHLVALGVGSGTIVAICLQRSVDLVVAVFAVVKAGAAYLPVDPSDPVDRVTAVLADARSPVVLASTSTAGIVAPRDEERRTRTRTVLLDTAETRLWLLAYPQDELTDGDRLRPVTAQDIAYVIYTSGSSGRPKGVLIGRAALATYLTYARDSYPSAGGHSLLHSSISFDMAVTTLFTPLLSGGWIRVTDLRAASPGDEHPDTQPTFLKVTPSHMGLLQALPAGYSPSRQLVVGGELLTAAATDAWRRLAPTSSVINEYGPTEATVGCCVYTVAPGVLLEPGGVAIGWPTPGTELYVLDEQLQPVVGQQPGELHIAGAQLARGYLNQPELTATAFVANPFGKPGSRMYRTGDLVRSRPDGALEYLGRIDDQIKIRGYRVEPGEVEAALLAHPTVARATVVVREREAQASQLVAYVVPAPGRSTNDSLLLDHLSRRLPEYLVPSAVVVLGTLPLTPNGKLDVCALPAAGPDSRAAFVPPRTVAESVLCELAGQVLDAPRPGIDDDLFALGLDSLIAARLVTLARRSEVPVGLMDVLSGRSVRAIAERLPS